MDNVLIGMRKEDIDTPALCVDADLMEANIRTMMKHLSPLGVQLRPHTKTHKCPIMARKQLEAGAIGVCCAKLGEAEAMAEGGVTGILIPNQVVSQRKIARLVNLAGWADVMVAVVDPANAAALDAAAQAKGVRLKVLIEVDVGMDRCGVRTVEEGLRLAREIAARSGLDFRGIMGYEGHCVMAEPFEERERITRASLEKLIQTRDAVEATGIPVPIVSSGGTGTYAITPTIAGITEIQAGSYITMDAKYRSVGLTAFDMALTVLSTVISVPRPDLAVCDIGMKSMTKEFGMPVVARPAGWEVLALSEEHGKLQRAGGPALHPGDVIELYPSHGCTTINLHDSCFVTRRGLLEAVWPITARGKFK
jgi:D-serine deaminase-like pyridoxal phosphate-dependent protein